MAPQCAPAPKAVKHVTDPAPMRPASHSSWNRMGSVPAVVFGALTAIEKLHPSEEHYYLEAIGTHQDAQGTGVGSLIIRTMLDRCDEEGLPAYLESSNPRNVPFYGRHGFEITREIEVGEGAPTVTAMWRTPR